MTDDLRALLDHQAVARVVADYGHCIDYGEADQWLDLFTPDARYVLRYREGLIARSIGRPRREGADLVYAGRDALASFIREHSCAPAAWHKHVVSGLRIDLDGDRASAASGFLRVDQLAAGAGIVAAGRYRDRFERGSDGRWRFAERIAEIEIQ